MLVYWLGIPLVLSLCANLWTLLWAYRRDQYCTAMIEATNQAWADAFAQALAKAIPSSYPRLSTAFIHRMAQQYAPTEIPLGTPSDAGAEGGV